MRDVGKLDKGCRIEDVENLGILEIFAQNFLKDYIWSERKSDEPKMTLSFCPELQQEWQYHSLRWGTLKLAQV